MFNKLITYLLFSLLLVIQGVSAQVSDPIPFTYPEGTNLLMQSEHKTDYWTLTRYFDTQVVKTFCSVGAAIVVLNSLEIEKPISERLGGYPLFTQDEHFFTDAVLEYTNPEQVNRKGIDIEEMVPIFETFGVRAELYYGNAVSLEEFREILKTILSKKGTYLIANYHRGAVGQVGSGHYSPIAAYNETTDQVLILDVARYKYPPVWVDVPVLLGSMRKIEESRQQSRGFLIVSPLEELL